MVSMKPGDLVTVVGACYDAPINHYDAGAAIRHSNWTFIIDGRLVDGWRDEDIEKFSEVVE